MTKFTLFNVLMIGAITSATAQTMPSAITINKKIQPGLVLELPNTVDMVEGTILQKLKETGYTPETKGKFFWKKNKVDGFYVFSGVKLPALDNQKLDMYFKVDQKNKTQKDHTTLYMLVSKGYDNFISSGTDSATFSAASDFLNGFVDGTASYRLNLDIEEQEKVVQSAERKLDGLQNDNKELGKKIEVMQADLRNKTDDEAMQQKEIEQQKTKLEKLKAKVAVK